MSRHALIRAALRLLSLSRAPRWLPAVGDANGFVVTLHHVKPQTAGAFQPNALLSITDEFLDRFLAHFLASGWRFVSLEELVRDKGGPRRIAVTLDDGYRDNLLHAAPVFRRHSVPYTIFICPGFCDRTAELWWEALERMIANADSFPLAGQSVKVPTRDPQAKLRAFRTWTHWLTQVADEKRQRQDIRALSEQYELHLGALAAELVMDWDEVCAIASDPLCTIGAHTMTHPALARLAADGAILEMRDSADRIEREIGSRPSMLAFPYGYRAAAGEREAALARDAGFAASFTTRPGYIRSTGARQGLPRVSINGLFQDVSFLDVLLTPGLWRLIAGGESGSRGLTVVPRAAAFAPARSCALLSCAALDAGGPSTRSARRPESPRPILPPRNTRTA
jgi:peptidoglycan/xylan/chitin deacetylase (PgdA/CDA1 family)